MAVLDKYSGEVDRYLSQQESRFEYSRLVTIVLFCPPVPASGQLNSTCWVIAAAAMADKRRAAQRNKTKFPMGGTKTWIVLCCATLCPWRIEGLDSP